MIAYLAFGVFCLVMAYTVYDIWRATRTAVKWGEDVPVVSGFQCVETLRRAKEKGRMRSCPRS